MAVLPDNDYLLIFTLFVALHVDQHISGARSVRHPDIKNRINTGLFASHIHTVFLKIVPAVGLEPPMFSRVRLMDLLFVSLLVSHSVIIAADSPRRRHKAKCRGLLYLHSRPDPDRLYALTDLHPH